MSVDFVSAFRGELREAAVRQVRIHHRRRRISVALAVTAAAILLVGGAIAAQNRWLSASSTGEIELGAAHAQFDHLTSRFTACMATHGAHRVAVPGGGWTYRNAAAVSACGAYVASITLTCRTLKLRHGQITNSEAVRCAPVAHMTIGPPLLLHK